MESNRASHCPRRLRDAAKPVCLQLLTKTVPLLPSGRAFNRKLTDHVFRETLNVWRTACSNPGEFTCRSLHRAPQCRSHSKLAQFLTLARLCKDDTHLQRCMLLCARKRNHRPSTPPGCDKHDSFRSVPHNPHSCAGACTVMQRSALTCRPCMARSCHPPVASLLLSLLP